MRQDTQISTLSNWSVHLDSVGHHHIINGQVRGIATGLEYLHSQDTVHSDLKSVRHQYYIACAYFLFNFFPFLLG